jgi:hypothetical protein
MGVDHTFFPDVSLRGAFASFIVAVWVVSSQETSISQLGDC